jgi:hypothetical protein
MFAMIFRAVKLAFIGLVIVTILALIHKPPEDRGPDQELVVPAEAWVLQRHKALREGTIPTPSPDPPATATRPGPSPAWPSLCPFHLPAADSR